MKKTNITKVVIKIGTGILTDEAGNFTTTFIKEICRQVSLIIKKGIKITLVSSGSIGSGMIKMDIKKRPKIIPQIQAIASIGQVQLMKLYEKIFAYYNLKIAQILLTKDDFRNRTRYTNAKNTLFTLYNFGVIPIINENDTVAVDEIKFGDNDNLSALVTNLVEAELLIILTDVDGFYNEKGIIKTIKKITKTLETKATISKKDISIGGMITKLQAAKIVMNAGEYMVIANGKRKNTIIDILNGKEIGTVFMPKQKKMNAYKRWIAFNLPLSGTIIVDDGAMNAIIKNGKSLLPSGILKIEGNFDIGKTVEIATQDGNIFGRGLVNYSSAELNKIKGCQSKEISKILGYKYFDEIIHRDNLVVWE